MAINEFSLALQRLYIEKYYGECIKSIKIKKNRLIFIMNLRPSEESQAYTVKIECKKSRRPRVWLLSPCLETFNGNLPHHLYPAKKKDKYPELCIYDSRKGYNELPKNKPFAYTLIPWILSWLSAYEFWVITGKWHHAEVRGGKQFN